MKVRDFHQSGRFDATEDQWATAVEAATARADIGMITEARDRVQTPRGWDQWNGGAEPTLLWDRGIWRLDAFLPVVLTERSWYLGDKVVTHHERHGVVGVFGLLTHKLERRTLLRGGFHVPSSIQGGKGWSLKRADRDNVAAAKDVLANLAPQVIRLQDLLRPDETTISADWNVHLGLPEWRDRIDGALVGTGMRLRPPEGPTLGKARKVDAHASTMRRDRDRDDDPIPVRVLPKRAGFDHRGALAALTDA